MKVRVKFFGSLQHDLNQESIYWPISIDSTIRDLVKDLIQKTKYRDLQAFFYDSLEVKRSLLIFLNDQEISTLNGITTKLREGDELTFIPVIHGGFIMIF